MNKLFKIIKLTSILSALVSAMFIAIAGISKGVDLWVVASIPYPYKFAVSIAVTLFIAIVITITIGVIFEAPEGE